jgi:hypothetical protein
VSQEKEWTLLVFLNGNNNLDRFGALNINQMEQIGSTADINVVVQWASLANKKTQRLFITKDTDNNKVTSPVMEDMGKVDMGDWKNLVEFVRWGVKNYPAKHYFIDIWDHGSGWHALHALGDRSGFTFQPFDISWDDNSRNHITTEQLAEALSESAKIIGHKVDLYASDACLMAMVEIADQVGDSVEVYAGSEEVEAGEGWPYQTFLKRWADHPKSTAIEVGTILTEEFVASYNGGVNGHNDATFSTFDLTHLENVKKAVQGLGKNLQTLNEDARKKVLGIMSNTQNFTYNDYADLTDFVLLLEASQIPGLDKTVLEETKTALKNLIVSHAATSSYARALGAAIWLPYSKYQFNTHIERYKGLKFDQSTKWSEALQFLNK